MLLLGISGKKQSGKTYAALAIQQAYGSTDKVAIVNFADALKEEVCKWLNITPEELETNKPKYRHVLQFYGTDFRREFFGKDYWIKEWLKRIHQLKPEIEIVVAADVRFENEKVAISKLGGYNWRITCSTQTYSDQHPSEISLDGHNFDMNLVNCLDNKFKIDILGALKLTINEHNIKTSK